MNNVFNSLIVFIILFSCTYKATEQNLNETQTNKVDSIKCLDSLLIKKLETNHIEEMPKDSFDIEGFDFKDIVNNVFYGVIVETDEKNTIQNVYFDITNGCYSCEMLLIKIEPNFLKVIDYCSSNIILKEEILTINTQSNSIDLNSNSLTINIKKIKHQEIFLIDVESKVDLVFKNELFMKMEDLIKLEINDCGEFDG